MHRLIIDYALHFPNPTESSQDIPGTENTPYAFGLFTAGIFILGVVLIAGLEPESSKHFRRDRIERAFSSRVERF
jgi:hypothetical protein